MTREEAIKALIGLYDGSEAILMAIEALERVSFENDTEIKSCSKDSDLISRSEAYRRITELSRDLLSDGCINLGNASEYLRIIRELPSADRPSEDLISREEAIKSLNGEVAVTGEANKDEVVSYIKTIMMRIKDLPSADRPKGEWIDEDGTYYANCSMCGYQMDTHQERGYFRFCPNCGSDKRERSE